MNIECDVCFNSIKQTICENHLCKINYCYDCAIKSNNICCICKKVISDKILLNFSKRITSSSDYDNSGIWDDSYDSDDSDYSELYDVSDNSDCDNSDSEL